MNRYRDEYTEALTRRFYQQKAQFNNFENICDYEIETVKEEINRLGFIKEEQENNYNLYLRVLSYILTRLRSSRNYDKKIVLLIEAVDPELITFKEYIKSNIISKKAIIEAPKDEQKKLCEIRNGQICDYQNKVREEIGFYDSNLAIYEQKYYNKFYREEKINELKK